MKKFGFTFLTGLIFSLVWLPGVFSQKSDYYMCHWESGLTANAGETLTDRMQFDEKSSFLYYFSNDETNLYIYLIISEKASLQKIMRYGMTTWLNPDSRHKKSLGIQFPLPAGEGSGQPTRKEGQAPGDRKDMMMALMAAKNKEMVLIGFSGKGIRDTIQPVAGAEFYAKLEMLDREKMLMRFKVPFIKIENTGKGEPDSLISVGFETGYMDLNRQGMGNSGGDQQSQGGGHGGGMYGGPPPSSAGMDKAQNNQEQSSQVSIAELSKPTRLWISEVKLSAR